MELDLTHYGLSKGEDTIYQALLKIKTGTIRELSKETGMHRTNIYDICTKLREKGLITLYKESRVYTFKCADPENLLDYLKYREQELEKVLPELKKKFKTDSSKVDVEVFKGRQGLVAAYNDMLRSKTSVLGYGISGNFRRQLPKFWEVAYNKIIVGKTAYKLIYSQKLHKYPPPFELRHIKKEFHSPTEVLIYDDKVLQIIWSPEMKAILITSKTVADSHRKQFDILWRQAKKYSIQL